MEIGKVGDNGINSTIESSKTQASDDSFKELLEGAVKNRDKEGLKKVCQEFEGFFLNMMFKQMKATIPKSEFIPKGTGREIYDAMMDETLMGEASKNRGFGLADMLYKRMCKEYNIEDEASNKGGAKVDKGR